MKKRLIDFYKTIFVDIRYWGPLLLMAMIAYGFSITNRTVSMDDLAYSIYFIDPHYMITSRWGQEMWVVLFSITQNFPFSFYFVATMMGMASSVFLACIFYSLNNRKEQNVIVYTLLSVGNLVFPIICETWPYSGAALSTFGNMLVSNFCILCLIECFEKKYNKRVLIITGVLMSIVVAGYEAGVFYYILTVMLLLWYVYTIIENRKNFEWIKDGLYFAVPLAIASVLRVVLGYVFRILLNLSYANPGATGIYWGEVTVKGFLKDVFINYFAKALVYFPMTIFVISMMIFVLICLVITLKNKNINTIIIGGLTLIMIFLQALIQGVSMPYRTAHTLIIFCAFVLYMVMYYTLKIKNKIIKYFITFLLFWLCMRESMYLCNINSLNNLRSDNEAAIAYQLGYDIESNYEEKPIVVLGTYYFGDWIDQQIKINPNKWNGELYIRVYEDIMNEPLINYSPHDTALTSVLFWSEISTGMMDNYFSYYGFNFDVLEDDATRKEAEEIAQKNNMGKYEILETKEYIIVTLE